MVLPKLIPGVPAWDASDSAALRAFLVNPTGQRLLQNLIFTRPTVSGTDRDARAIASDERAGYEAAIADLMLLGEPRAITEDDREASRVTEQQIAEQPVPGA